MKNRSSKTNSKKRGGSPYQSTATKVGLAVLYLVIVYIIIILVIWFIKKDKMYKTLPGGMTVYINPRSQKLKVGQIDKPFHESMPGMPSSHQNQQQSIYTTHQKTAPSEPEHVLTIRQGKKAAQLLMGNEAASDIAKKESYLHHNMPYY